MSRSSMPGNCPLSGICALVLVVGGLFPATAEGQRIQEQLWIGNSSGADVHIYEVGTWELLRVQTVGESPHGISASPDGRTVHVTPEYLRSGSRGEVLWIDAPSGRITDRLRLEERPNEQEVTEDGRFLYVPSRLTGEWLVVDNQTKQIAKRIHTGGDPHNTVTDGRYMYLASREQPFLFIADPAANHEVIAKVEMGGNAGRPLAVSKDGQRVYQGVDGLIGFEVVDVPNRRVIARIETEAHDPSDPNQSRSHGITMTPDQTEVWSSWLGGGMVYVHERASGEYRVTHRIKMPMVPGQTRSNVFWLSNDPQGRYIYVSMIPNNQVVVLDAKTKEIVTILETGDGPKRTKHVMVPLGAGDAGSDR